MIIYWVVKMVIFYGEILGLMLRMKIIFPKSRTAVIILMQEVVVTEYLQAKAKTMC